MSLSNPMDRRQFVKIGTLAVSAAGLPNMAMAQAAASHSLPGLAYKFDALEPHIDVRTMEIHHGKHHAGYISNLNTALGSSPDLGKSSLESMLANLPGVADESLRTTLRNNGGGHWNHDFFWKIMTPAERSGKPSEPLAEAIQSAFGSMDDFKKSFGEAATKRFGSGWAWLIVQGGKLKITSTPNQDNPLMKGIVPDSDLGAPILGLDVWEHAYYLHYQNRRPDYITAWWNVVDWAAVSKNFDDAS
jgi:Fe-Mn family superoxide dismutase